MPGGKGSSRARRLPTRTKIVATLGPASRTLSQIRALLRAGADVFRVNFSHGTPGEHNQTIRRVRRAAKQEGRPVAVLADLQGPKIRVGQLKNGEPLRLERGAELVIVARPSFVGEPGRIGCSYEGLPSDVRPRDRILLDDGSLELRVERVDGDEIVTKVRYGGILLENKGINVPGTKVTAPALGPKDLFDLDLALTAGADFVALSFVRGPAELRQLRKRIDDFGADAEVIAKIERPEAVKQIESIVDASDGVMIARGDMGVELGADAVPAIQKRIIALCIEKAKPVITATQMLETMVGKPRPTRAEASDVANAIYDGTSAVMLSAETASGKYPRLAVKTMDRIARRTASEIFGDALRHPAQRVGDLRRTRRRRGLSIPEASVSAAGHAVLEAGAEVLAVFTETGRTAKLVARERLPARLVAFTTHARTYHKLALQWGIIPILTKRARTIERMLENGEELLLASKHARRGDRVVFVAGTVQVSGATNTVTLRTLGEA